MKEKILIKKIICKVCKKKRHANHISEITHNVGIEHGFENADDVKMVIIFYNDDDICISIAHAAKVLLKLAKR